MRTSSDWAPMPTRYYTSVLKQVVDHEPPVARRPKFPPLC